MSVTVQTDNTGKTLFFEASYVSKIIIRGERGKIRMVKNDMTDLKSLFFCLHHVYERMDDRT